MKRPRLAIRCVPQCRRSRSQPLRSLHRLGVLHLKAAAAAALQFPLGHPAVASVVTGMRSAAEVASNLAHVAAPIPAAFWDELRHQRLIAAHVPVGAAVTA